MSARCEVEPTTPAAAAERLVHPPNEGGRQPCGPPRQDSLLDRATDERDGAQRLLDGDGGDQRDGHQEEQHDAPGDERGGEPATAAHGRREPLMDLRQGAGQDGPQQQRLPEREAHGDERRGGDQSQHLGGARSCHSPTRGGAEAAAAGATRDAAANLARFTPRAGIVRALPLPLHQAS